MNARSRRRQWFCLHVNTTMLSISKLFAAKTLLRRKGRDVTNGFPSLIKTSPRTMFENRRRKKISSSYPLIISRMSAPLEKYRYGLKSILVSVCHCFSVCLGKVLSPCWNAAPPSIHGHYHRGGDLTFLYLVLLFFLTGNMYQTERLKVQAGIHLRPVKVCIRLGNPNIASWL